MFATRIERFRTSLTPWEIYQNVYTFSGNTGAPSFFLDSILYRKPDQRYSYIAAEPFLEVTLKNSRLNVSGAQRKSFSAREIFPVLRGLLKKYKTKPHKHPFFTGGAAGFWGYELAPLFDKVKFRKKPQAVTPDLWLGFFGKVIIYDHAKQVYYLSVNAENRKKAGEGFEELKKYFYKPLRAPEFHFREFKPAVSRGRFESMVRRAKRYIESGDIYQANLSQRFSFGFRGSSLRLYGALRKINPSPFASFFRIGDTEIISSSPERLVSLKGEHCETRPIAGTRPRGLRMEKELKANAKERAEHIMLVDLERNDLGRVCDYRSVKVEELMKIEKYSHVIHLVSKVTGKLQKGKDALDLLKAVFPGGTITGCPKIRCMEIIDELEPSQRGIYTGSIGYIDFQGNMDLNIVIRTILLKKNTGYFQTGAGIVYDSNPGREYEETLHKGEAMASALVQASVESGQ